ncbi:MAG TPA: S-layer homology domain-containing protein [Candidatus Obscuribacterales bacterium]
MVQSAPTSVQRYVHPERGNNNATGDRANPYKTLTFALQRAPKGSTIYLNPGTYSTASGETFPIQIPEGVTLMGEESNRGQAVIVSGGGLFSSASFGQQNVALVPADGVRLVGLSVTNPNARGTGVWIESGQPAIAHCTFLDCGREGVFVTGSATPELVNNLFRRNAASGISIVRNAKGELRHNIFQQTGYGIAISDQAAPLLADNQILENHSGIVLSRSARPVLRNNWIARNTRIGLLIRDTAQPDLGRGLSPGGNVFDGNIQADVVNESTAKAVSVGNQINLNRTTGTVEFAAMAPGATLPTPTPSSLQVRAEPVVVPPAPAPVPPAPVPAPPATASTTDVTLTDIQGYWAEHFIRGLVRRGIVSGFTDGTFRPELTVTRAQYATFVSQAFPLPDTVAPASFSDVPSNFWAVGAIAKAQTMGFLSGFADGTFRPNQTMSRVQVIESLVKGLDLTGGTPNSLQVYRDRNQIPSQAAVAVATATQKRMVVNHPLVDMFNPMQTITRAQLSALLYQALVITGRGWAIASPFIVEPALEMPSFSDIDGHWAAPFIRGLASQGFIRGFVDGTFRPNALMTRAEYAALLSGTFNPLPDRPVVTFDDVPSSFWAAGVIQRAYRGKWLSGFGDGSFRPQDNLLKLHVLLSLASGLGLEPGDRQFLNIYTDKDRIPTYALDAVAAATAQEIVVNHPQLRELNPNQTATRGEVTAMVYQALVYAQRSQPVTSTFVVKPDASISNDPDGSVIPTDPGGAVVPAPTAPRVMLDPGHGGTDPGTVGVGGLKEKDLVLPVAQSVAFQLQQAGVRVALTRSTDQAVVSDERVKLAEDFKADVFISIHANALSLSRYEVNGVETYYYRTSDEGGELARVVHDQILQKVGIKDLGVRQATFLTLRQTTMPSVLVEVGYVTTQTDETNLIDETYVKQLADGIAEGIKVYLRRRGAIAS